MSRPALETIRDERCKRDPLYWAQNWTKTENPHYQQQGVSFLAAFPSKEYFPFLFKYLRDKRKIAERAGKCSRVLIPKTREMMTSWCVVVYGTHLAQWLQGTVIVQTDSEDKAKELVGYANCLYRNQPEWLKARHPLAKEASSLGIEWKAGGRLFGIPKGENKLRLYHPTLYIMDEAAFLPEAEQCFNAAVPVAKQIIGVSSAGPGWFGDECSQ